MPFAVPDGLAPELYPLAWLLGTWRGPGFLAYPGIPERPFVHEVVFDHDGGPYLTYRSTMWLLDVEDVPTGEAEESDRAAEEPAEGSDSTEVRYVAGPVWASESGFWRAAPASGGTQEAVPGAGVRTELEVLLAEPSGHVSLYLGAAEGPRIEIATDLVARTATAADVSAASRMYGLVGGELMWAMDLAAFGHDLQSYASARLARIEPSPDDAP
jgi:hypothetical protein